MTEYQSSNLDIYHVPGISFKKEVTRVNNDVLVIVCVCIKETALVFFGLVQLSMFTNINVLKDIWQILPMLLN
jgi:hypothetical protein